MTLSSLAGQWLDHHLTREMFRQDVAEGLSREQKELPCKYFYDQAGSALFEQICELDEYYLTRAELAIMRSYTVEMAQTIGPEVMLIEFGSGSGLKTRLLLERLEQPLVYVPIDIAKRSLIDASKSIAAQFPHVEVLPVCADFTATYELPTLSRPSKHRVVYFPGSTIGNFDPEGCVELLRRMAALCDSHGGVLIGIDLQKDVEVLEAAYNDRMGITAQFNLNILVRANREIGTDFALDAFQHRAVYNVERGCIEMHLDCLKAHVIRMSDQKFEMRAGESILTERSHKFTVEDFSQMARRAELQLAKVWTDDAGQFSVLYLTRNEERGGRGE